MLVREDVWSRLTDGDSTKSGGCEVFLWVLRRPRTWRVERNSGLDKTTGLWLRERAPCLLEGRRK